MVVFHNIRIYNIGVVVISAMPTGPQYMFMLLLLLSSISNDSVNIYESIIIIYAINAMAIDLHFIWNITFSFFCINWYKLVLYNNPHCNCSH